MGHLEGMGAGDVKLLYISKIITFKFGLNNTISWIVGYFLPEE
jgi:Flp pilus assembly protein protease CpaA